MTTDACFWSSVLRINSSSPTPYSSRRIGSRQHGKHPRSKHWHLLDYAFTRQRDTRDVLHIRVMPSADCYTDHRLVGCKVACTFKSPPKRKGPRPKKLQVHKLRNPTVKNGLQVMLEERLHYVTAAEPEDQWMQMKTMLQEIMAEVAGLSTWKHRDWFDEADKEI